MRYQALWSNLRIKCPTNSETNNLLPAYDDHTNVDVPSITNDPSTNVAKKNLSGLVPNPKPILDKPPWINEEATWDVPHSNPGLDDPHSREFFQF